MAKSTHGPRSPERIELVERVLGQLREELVNADSVEWDWRQGIHEPTLDELIDRGLMEGYKHYEMTVSCCGWYTIHWHKAVASGR